jgi:hypothetical protein
MAERFAYKRGHGAKRRVMHLAAFDRLGRWAGVLCGSRLDFNTTCNLPLALPICKRCRAVEERITQNV